jgi:hypothetical protein
MKESLVKHRGALLLRLASALAVIATLTGSVVVSCTGDATPNTGDGSNASSSGAMGQWQPTAQDTCTKAFHDTFFVLGPDGKKYPTWHRTQETDPATNQTCSFGHHHGADPSGSALWPALQRHFGFDANLNGLIDGDELARAGIPFGLVSERLASTATPRLEDHTAYKIAFVNFAERTRVSGGSGTTFDVRCDLFVAYNQPTSTADAFASNMFSVTYAADCNSGSDSAQYPVSVIVSLMGLYGAPGTFTLADGTQQPAGSAVPSNSPPGGNELGRLIPTRNRVFAGVFVPVNQTSNFTALFERWETQLRIRDSSNAELATLNPAFRVEDTARYFDSNVVPDQLAHSVDLCYMGLDASGAPVTDPGQAVLQVRNSPQCSRIAPNGPSTPASQRVTFDKKESPFRDCTRSAFFGSDVVRNNGGRTIWFTDAFGGNASNVAFPNSIQQFIGQGNTTTVVVNAVGTQFTCQDDPSVHVPN